MRKRRQAVVVMALVAVAGAVPAAAATLSNPLADVTITGRVTASGTGVGVPGMCVYASRTADGSGGGQATTDAAGKYALTFRFGSSGEDDFTVWTAADCGAGGYWTGARYGDVSLDPSAGKSTASGIDMVTGPAGRIVGRISDSVTGSPLSGASVLADGGWSSGTGKNGTFVIGGLAPGSHSLQLWGPSPLTGHLYYLDEDFHHQPESSTTPDLVTVVAGQDTTINESLLRADSLTGTVTVGSTGVPAPYVHVYIMQFSGGWSSYYMATTTGPLGGFRFDDLGPGTYAVCFASQPKHPLFGPRCWRNKPYPYTTAPHAWTNATPLHVNGFGSTVRIQQPLPLAANE